jgi:peroxiredoxin
MGMKFFKILLIVLLVISPAILFAGQKISNAYSISVGITNASAGEKVCLQKYKGTRLVTIDSVATPFSGSFTISGISFLEPGMYTLSLNQKPVINFFISNEKDQHFSILFDRLNPTQSLSFVGSSENQAFIDYLRFLSAKTQSSQQAMDEINRKGEELCKQFPGSMLHLFIHTMKEPEIPMPVNTVSDKQTYAYNYLSNHFFDNIDFKDKRLLNTPILDQKLGFYFRKIVIPQTDSITEKIKVVVNKAKANALVYNSVVRFLYNLFREAAIQGNTDIYNFIGVNYILIEPNRWNDNTFIENVRNRVAKAKINPVGSKATNLKLQTPDGKIIELSKVEATKIILLFYNPECEACHSVTETLMKIYNQNRQKGIQVFAVYIDSKKELWTNYIAAKKLDWINVYDPLGNEAIDKKYDINAIPMIYLLDKDKNIIAKDIPVEDLMGLLE